jgi:hypothetical protein
MNIAATTATAISPDGDGGAVVQGSRDERRDVTGSGHGEPAGRLVVPAGSVAAREAVRADVIAGPRAGRPPASPADVIEGGGGVGWVVVHAAAAEARGVRRSRR